MGTHSSDFGGRRGRRGCGANALSEVAVIAPEDGGDKSVGATGAGAARDTGSCSSGHMAAPLATMRCRSTSNAPPCTRLATTVPARRDAPSSGSYASKLDVIGRKAE